ncbi:cysteine-rich secretory protein LCCL domain-containing 1-like [Ciona intestinalis]
MKISMILFVIFATTYADKVYHNITCNTIGMDFNTFIKHVRCPANCKLQYYKVWGSIRYYGYSQVCAAAIHDGQITNSGGKVTVYLYKGKRRYRGNLQHGIRSDSDYNFYGIAFNFRKMSACHHSDMVVTNKVYSIDCPQNCSLEAPVYGTGVYRSDYSTICASAIHDGVITRGKLVDIIKK